MLFRVTILEATLFVALLFGVLAGVTLAAVGLLSERRSRWPWERR